MNRAAAMQVAIDCLQGRAEETDAQCTAMREEATRFPPGSAMRLSSLGLAMCADYLHRNYTGAIAALQVQP